MRSGDIELHVTTGPFRHAGGIGFDWTSRSSSTNVSGAAIPSGYHLSFGPSGVGPSSIDTRWLAFPLRCLSTVLGM